MNDLDAHLNEAKRRDRYAVQTCEEMAAYLASFK